MRVPLLGVALALCLMVQARAQTDAPVLLQRVFRPGQVIRVRANTTSQVGGAQLTQTVNLKQEVKAVKANGDLTLLVTVEGGHAKSPFGEQDIPGGATITETWDKQGHLLEWKRGDKPDNFIAEPIRQTLAGMSDFVFPDKPVRAGETWKTVRDNPFLRGKRLTYSTTFVGFEMREGRKLWKITQTASAEMASKDINLTTELTAWLDPVNGQSVRVESKDKSIPTAYGPMDNTTVLLTLDPAAPQEAPSGTKKLE